MYEEISKKEQLILGTICEWLSQHPQAEADVAKYCEQKTSIPEGQVFNYIEYMSL